MAKLVAQSASRALGLLTISKDKVFGGMPLACFTQCYGATVQSIIDYSAAIWGTKSMSCINAVQYRACRYFLAGAPNSAKFRGGCRGPSKIRQRGGCNNFLLFTH